jgi:hypothetical protein
MSRLTDYREADYSQTSRAVACSTCPAASAFRKRAVNASARAAGARLGRFEGQVPGGTITTTTRSRALAAASHLGESRAGWAISHT